MGIGENARQRRVVYHYSAKRDRRDNHTLDKQVERAQKIADGKRPLKKDRFVKLTGTRPAVDQVLVDRARQLAGLKGYVTNIPAIRLTGNQVVAAYHELFQVERSFRMAKTDLRARPMFHHERDSIHAHLTVVFTALAISRHLQDATGFSIRRVIRALRPLRDVTISINGNEIVATTPPGPTPRTPSSTPSPRASRTELARVRSCYPWVFATNGQRDGRVRVGQVRRTRALTGRGGDRPDGELLRPCSTDWPASSIASWTASGDCSATLAATMLLEEDYPRVTPCPPRLRDLLLLLEE